MALTYFDKTAIDIFKSVENRTNLQKIIEENIKQYDPRAYVGLDDLSRFQEAHIFEVATYNLPMYAGSTPEEQALFLNVTFANKMAEQIKTFIYSKRAGEEINVMDSRYHITPSSAKKPPIVVEVTKALSNPAVRDPAADWARLSGQDDYYAHKVF